MNRLLVGETDNSGLVPDDWKTDYLEAVWA
jgi:hypothetical protein